MIRTLTIALVATLALAPAAAAKKKSPNRVDLRGGATTLALDPGTAQVLTQDLGISVGVLRPGKATSKGLRFPITPSRLNAKTLAGTIRHRGGISFSKGDTTVALRNFRIRINGSPDLTAKVGGTRLSILDLDLSNAKVTTSKRGVKVKRVRASLTQGAADALNQAFSTNAFAGGLPIGTATVDGRFKRNH
jgi:hypothetical protein